MFVSLFLITMHSSGTSGYSCNTRPISWTGDIVSEYLRP